MGVVKNVTAVLSALYRATLATMYGSRPRGRTVLTVALALLALALAPAPAALGQSAGDDQYADPLVTDGEGGGTDQPADPAPDTPTSDAGEQPAPAPTDATGAVDLPAGAEPGDAFADDPATAEALPRTGVDAWLLAALGLASLVAGTVGLAATRDSRHPQP